MEELPDRQLPGNEPPKPIPSTSCHYLRRADNAPEANADLQALRAQGLKPRPEHYRVVAAGKFDGAFPPTVADLRRALCLGDDAAVGDILEGYDGKAQGYWYVNSDGLAPLEEFDYPSVWLSRGLARDRAMTVKEAVLGLDAIAEYLPHWSPCGHCGYETGECRQKGCPLIVKIKEALGAELAQAAKEADL